MQQLTDTIYTDVLEGGAQPSSGSSVPTATIADTLAVFAQVLLPTIAKGIIIRRPGMVSLAEKFNFDGRAVQRVQRVRDKYGSGPLLLRTPGRSYALILDASDVHEVLNDTPEPFATATKEKVASLSHFEPKGVLISRGEERTDRRRYNEQVLNSGSPVHQLAGGFLQVVQSEAEQLCRPLVNHGELEWCDFSAAWFRIVRRVLFGEAARDDHQITKLMVKLRSAANWAFLVPQSTKRRNELLRLITDYMLYPDSKSLTGVMEHTPSTIMTAPAQQVTQWLFAFDAAAVSTFRALALLARHPAYAQLVRQEIRTNSGAARAHLPYTRAAVMESLRLWPTTPLILRETTRETIWPNGVLPAHTSTIIYAPFFHRRNAKLAHPDQFSPEIWANSESTGDYGLVPFSDGPAVCPGRHLVLLLTSAMIAAVLDNACLRLQNTERLNPTRPLPGTLNHFNLRFELAPVTMH